MKSAILDKVFLLDFNKIVQQFTVDWFLKYLCRCSTGGDPVTDPTTLGSVAKVVES